VSYITVADYVRRFGERETIGFKNENVAQAGQPLAYDPVKVEEQLNDATDIVDSYVSRRYATPLQSVPTVVRGWVAALARHKLASNTGRVADAIQKEADRVYAQLDRLAASKIDLPIPEGSPAAAPASVGNAQSSGDREAPMFSGGMLDSYSSPSLGLSPVACWRRNGS
jgi:phage gp36-like protein